MDWIRISIKKVDRDDWELFQELREEFRMETGKVFGDMVQFYAEHHFVPDE